MSTGVSFTLEQECQKNGEAMPLQSEKWRPPPPPVPPPMRPVEKNRFYRPIALIFSSCKGPGGPLECQGGVSGSSKNSRN